MDPVWAEVLAVVNAVLAGVIVFCNGRLLGRSNGHRWLRWMNILIGLYWAGIYVFVAVADSSQYNPVFFGRVFIRPAFTITLAVMAASSLFRMRSYGR